MAATNSSSGSKGGGEGLKGQQRETKFKTHLKADESSR